MDDTFIHRSLVSIREELYNISKDKYEKSLDNQTLKGVMLYRKDQLQKEIENSTMIPEQDNPWKDFSGDEIYKQINDLSLKLSQEMIMKHNHLKELSIIQYVQIKNKVSKYDVTPEMIVKEADKVMFIEPSVETYIKTEHLVCIETGKHLATIQGDDLTMFVCEEDFE